MSIHVITRTCYFISLSKYSAMRDIFSAALVFACLIIGQI